MPGPEAYYYSRNGAQGGPVTAQELKTLAESGGLTPSDLVWKEGMPEWVVASRMKGLFPAAAAGSATPPPMRPTSTPPGIPPAGPATPPSNGEGLPEFAAMNASRRKPQANAAEDLAKQAKDVALAAGTDAMKAFKAMAANPVGGMKTAFESLGAQRAMIVGLVFGGAFDLFVFLGGRMIFLDALSYMSWGRLSGADIPAPRMSIGDLFKLLILGLVPIASATAGCAVARKLFHGKGSIQSDIFIAGASLLPFAIAILGTGFLGPANLEISAILWVFALTTTVLMLYSGCTTVLCIPEAAATLAVPLILCANVYVCKILVASLMKFTE
jgi:hypothetical protein